MSLRVEAAYEYIGRKYFKHCKVISPKYLGPLAQCYKIYLKDSDDIADDTCFSINWSEHEFVDECLDIFEEHVKALKKYVLNKKGNSDE